MKLDFFLGQFLKNPQIANFVKIRPVGTVLLHADGRMDTAKVTVAFRSFTKAPKNRDCHKRLV